MSTVDRAVDWVHWKIESGVSLKKVYYLLAISFFVAGGGVLLSNEPSFDAATIALVLWAWGFGYYIFGQLIAIRNRVRELDDVDRKLSELIIALDEPIPADDRYRRDR